MYKTIWPLNFVIIVSLVIRSAKELRRENFSIPIISSSNIPTMCLNKMLLTFPSA